MSEAILAIEQLEKSYGGIRAVAGTSFTVKRGSLTALIGPNGAGKTTLFDLVTGFVHPDRGAIRFEGRAIAGLPPHRIARLGLVRTFQLTRVFAAMTVMENMMLAPLGQPGESLLGLITPGGRSRRSEAALGERAMALLGHFNLQDKSADYAGTLSGGQRKLLELARALMASPRMVLLDELMAGVNRVL
jgi:branched-chain amino acid transport system ATP-binding protein